MYNFNLMNNEEVIAVFDKLFIKQDDNEKITTIALTNKRLLFLDYLVQNEGLEVLRIARGASYPMYKDIYHQTNLDDIEKITNEKSYKVILKDQTYFEFDNKELYDLLKGSK